VEESEALETRITTSSWTEFFADWSRPPDGGAPEEILTPEDDISQLWRHSECASYVDGYIEQRSSEVQEVSLVSAYFGNE